MDFLLRSETEELEMKKKLNEAELSEKYDLYFFQHWYHYLHYLYLLLAVTTLRLDDYKDCCLPFPLH